MWYLKSVSIIIVILFSFSSTYSFSKELKTDVNKVKTTIRKVNYFDKGQIKLKQKLSVKVALNTGTKKIHISKKSLNKTKIDNQIIKQSNVNESNFPEAKIVANPQPAKDIVTISLHSNDETVAYMKVFSIDGRNLIEKNIDLKNGLNNILIDISFLSSGNYFCVIEHGITFKRCRFMVF